MILGRFHLRNNIMGNKSASELARIDWIDMACVTTTCVLTIQWLSWQDSSPSVIFQAFCLLFIWEGKKTSSIIRSANLKTLAHNKIT